MFQENSPEQSPELAAVESNDKISIDVTSHDIATLRELITSELTRIEDYLHYQKPSSAARYGASEKSLADLRAILDKLPLQA